MEILFELAYLLFQVILELLVEIIGEFLLGSARVVVGEPVWPREADPVLVVVGWLLVGAALGAVSLWLAPDTILRPGPFPGVSLIAAPVGVGLAMWLAGSWRRTRGWIATSLASFHGGAAFAFGFALVRVLAAA